jgi:hypothetical protein
MEQKKLKAKLRNKKKELALEFDRDKLSELGKTTTS